jgi:hypothetical protein
MSEDVTIRAARAQQLLEDEVLQEALDAMIKSSLAEAMTTDLSNPTECVAAIASIQAAGDFQDSLKQYITAGKAAERKPYKVA